MSMRAFHGSARSCSLVGVDPGLGGRRGEGGVRGEDAVVDEPGGGVELGEEGFDAPAEAVLLVGDGLEDGGADDGLRESLVGVRDDD